MVIILVSFVIGTIFLNWGMNRGSGGPSNMSSAGKINGREIPLNVFDREVNAERQKQERSASQQDQYQSHLVPQQVWERTVNQVLMKDFFRKTNISASAEEVFAYLKSNPVGGIDTMTAFKTNGVFDTSKYIAFLNDPKSYEYNPGLRQLELYCSEVIAESKLGMLLTAPLRPGRTEIEYFIRTEREKAVFEYVYVKGPARASDSTAVTPAMISRYYDAKRNEFATGGQVSVYYVKAPKIPTRRDEEVYFQELVDVKNRVMAQKNDSARIAAFTDEARMLSDDEQNAQNGGDLGTFGRGSMVPEFDAVAFSLEPGTVSNPVKTRFGYHLIYVEKREKKGSVEQVKARHILRRIVATIETNDLLSEKIDSLRRIMVDDGFVKAAAAAARKDPSILFDSTPLFERSGLVPGIGYVSGAGRFIFGPESQENNAISERLENSDGFYLLAIRQRVDKGTLPLAVAAPRIRQKLIDSISGEAARAFLVETLKKAAPGASIAQLRKIDSVRIGSGVSDTVTRYAAIPGLGANSKAAAVAFGLAAGKRSAPVECNGVWCVVRTLWKSPAVEVKPDAPEAGVIIERQMSTLRQRIYYDWYLDYKKKARIESNIDKIYLD